MTFNRETTSTDALLTDLYLDALLAGAVLDAAAASGSPDSAADQIDPAARRAADRLRHDLVRVHPSFRFEERLATRLAEAAVSLRIPVAAGGDGRVVAFSGPDSFADRDLVPLDPDGTPDPDQTAPDGATESSLNGLQRVPGRPLLIGGALTSAALSIAGAAFVAWRFGRPGRALTPMARAARAVREARLASGVPPTIAIVGRSRRRPD